jgi:hypothetical protein
MDYIIVFVLGAIAGPFLYKLGKVVKAKLNKNINNLKD